MRHVRIVILGILLLAVAAAGAHAAGPWFEPNGLRPDLVANACGDTAD